jgi:hypothetical protein
MEEKIGKRINVERTDEALTTDADLISTACPFCIVMLSDAVTAKQQEGTAKEGVQVLDVSQILARSLVPAKQPALVGAAGADSAPAITPDVVVEAPGPVAATPDATAGADQGMLAQTHGATGEPTVQDPASSGETLREVPTTGEPVGTVDPVVGANPGAGPAQSTGTPGDAPGGASEGQGPGGHERPEA